MSNRTIAVKKQGDGREEQSLTDVQILTPFKYAVNSGFETRTFEISRELSQQLLAATKVASNPSAVLLTIFQELLRRYTCQSAVSVDFYRDDEFICCLHLDQNLSLQTAAEANQFSSGIAAEQSPTATAGGGSQARFSFWEKRPPSYIALPREQTSSIHLIFDGSGPLKNAYLEFDPRLWSSDVVEGIACHFTLLLRWALTDVTRNLSDFDIVTAEERQQLIAWNQTELPQGSAFTYTLFADQAAKHPDRPALSYGKSTLTYAELARQVEHLANHLRLVGVGPDVLVGVHLERSAEMVIALMAIFQAGGAYLPLDPNLPPERLAYMQEDSRPRAIISNSRLRPNLHPDATDVLCVDELSALRSAPEQDWPITAPEHLAYVLYTSGSTGKPKGVQITHGALTTLLFAMKHLVPLQGNDVVLATTVVSFDISVFEIFGPLTSGAHVVVVSRAVATDGEMLAKLAAETGATMLQATPSGWRLLVEAGWRGDKGLTLLTAGEPLEPRLAQQLYARGKSVWNLYGPTEATVYATGKQIRANDPKITVGRPLANYKTYVLDERCRFVPAGAIGELYLGGPAIARGYLNRPDLTEEKFVPDPFSSRSGARMYRTGDLARMLPDGEIELLGRTDSQVKIRGYRIELGEVEARFESHPGIRKCVAQVEELQDGDKRLIAYIQHTQRPLPHSELHAYASRSLPAYMVPSAFVPVSAFPLNPSGKVDRKALKRDAQPQEACENETTVCADPLEQKVLEAWRLILQQPGLGLDDSFFEVGGHSLLATRIFVHLEQITGRRLPPSTLIEAPTVRLLSARLSAPSTTSCLVPLQPHGLETPLYFVHHMYGDVLAYRAIAELFAPDRPVIGIQTPTEILDDESLRSVESLAALYVKQILQMQDSGPFHLAGYSSGSVFAYEIAQQLCAAGHEVGLLALIDGEINGPRPSASRVLRWRKRIAGKACKIVFKFKDEWSEGPRHFVMKRLNHLWLQWRLRALSHRGLGQYRTGMSMQELVVTIENSYVPQRFQGPAVLIRFRDDAPNFDVDPLIGWSTLIEGGLDVLHLPGSHATAMMPNRVASLAAAITERLAQPVAQRLLASAR